MRGIISKKRRPNDENDPLNCQDGCSYAIPNEEDSQNRESGQDGPFLHRSTPPQDALAFSDAREEDGHFASSRGEKCRLEPFRCRLPPPASHPFQDDPAVGVHLRGAPPERIGDAGRQAGALLPVKSIDRSSVMVT